MIAVHTLKADVQQMAPEMQLLCMQKPLIILYRLKAEHPAEQNNNENKQDTPQYQNK